MVDITATGYDCVRVNGNGRGRIAYTNGDVLRGGKEPIDEDSHKGGVEPKLGSKVGEFSICHALRHDDCSDSNTSDEVSVKPLQIVSHNPACEWDQVMEVSHHFSTSRDDRCDVFSSSRLFFDIAVTTVDRKD